MSGRVTNKTRPPRNEQTHFLNVDVDVYGRTDLQPLVAALGKKVIVHYVGPEGREQSAHFSLASAYGEDADTLTHRLAGLIKRLPLAARQIWDRARRRDFNLGTQAGMKPFSHEIALTMRTLDRVVQVGGRIVNTTYAVVTPPKNARKSGARPAKTNGPAR